MFANIKNAFAVLVGSKAAVVTHNTDSITKARFQPDTQLGSQVKHLHHLDRTTTTSKKASNFEGIAGSVDVEVIKNCASDMLRKQLMGKLVYSYVAKGFNVWCKEQGRNSVGDALENALNNAAEAVAQSDQAGYITELDVERFSFLLTTGVPAKMSDANAKLITDITGGSVEELVAKREEKRKARFLANSNSLECYLNAIAGWVPVTKFDAMGDPIELPEPDLKLTGAAVVAAIANTMEFVSTWNDEIKMAAELMLIKRDHKMIERALAQSERRESGSAPDYVSKLDDQLIDAAGLAMGAASGK